MTDFEKIPERIRYYLLDFKDCNMSGYIERFGYKGLNSLSFEELNIMFIWATVTDKQSLEILDSEFSSTDLIKSMELFIENGFANLSILCRRFSFTYAKSMKIVQKLEALNLISQFEGVQNRKLLVVNKGKVKELILKNDEA